jgi:hypothetical protein
VGERVCVRVDCSLPVLQTYARLFLCYGVKGVAGFQICDLSFKIEGFLCTEWWLKRVDTSIQACCQLLYFHTTLLATLLHYCCVFWAMFADSQIALEGKFSVWYLKEPKFLNFL